MEVKKFKLKRRRERVGHLLAWIVQHFAERGRLSIGTKLKLEVELESRIAQNTTEKRKRFKLQSCLLIMLVCGQVVGA